MIANDRELQTTLERIAWFQQHVAHLGAGVVDRAHRRCGGGGERLRVGLDEVTRVGGGMVRAAARAGHDGTRRPGTQARAETGELRGVLRELHGNHAGTLGRLQEHARRFGHVLALSSATTS